MQLDDRDDKAVECCGYGDADAREEAGRFPMRRSALGSELRNVRGWDYIQELPPGRIRSRSWITSQVVCRKVDEAGWTRCGLTGQNIC